MRLVGLVIALVLALGAGVVAFKLFKGEKAAPGAVVVQPVKQDFETLNVLVASRPIGIGSVLEPDMLDSQPWPKHLVLENFVTSPDAAQSVVRMVARSAFQKGEPIVMSRLSNPDDPSFMAARLSPGMRVVTVASDGVAGVAGFVYPGDRVDVLVTHAVPGGVSDGISPEQKKESVTETLLANVRVLAVNQRAEGGGSEGKPELPSSISMEVRPEDAQRLRLAQETGSLSLALRGLGEGDEDVPPLTRVGDLSQAVVKSGRSEGSVIVIRGVQVTEAGVTQQQKEEGYEEGAR